MIIQKMLGGKSVVSFKKGEQYTRKEIKHLIGAPDPEKIGGIWGTGYAQYKDAFYVFVNVGVPGRTGHDYKNELSDNQLSWYTKSNAHFLTPTIQNMVSGEYVVHIFTREKSSNTEFIYQGEGTMIDHEDGKPAWILWDVT